MALCLDCVFWGEGVVWGGGGRLWPPILYYESAVITTRAEKAPCPLVRGSIGHELPHSFWLYSIGHRHQYSFRWQHRPRTTRPLVVTRTMDTNTVPENHVHCKDVIMVSSELDAMAPACNLNTQDLELEATVSYTARQ